MTQETESQQLLYAKIDSLDVEIQSMLHSYTTSDSKPNGVNLRIKELIKQKRLFQKQLHHNSYNNLGEVKKITH